MLATTVQEHPFEWESHLAKVFMAYNSSTHPATGYSPFFLMFGRQAKLPVDIVYGAPQEGSTHTDYAANLTKALNKNARAKMGTVAQRQKELYHHKVHGKPFEERDLVWLHNPAVHQGQSRKLYCPWTGPFQVVKRLSEAVYRVQNTRLRRQRRVVHFDRLKPCPPGMRFVSTDTRDPELEPRRTFYTSRQHHPGHHLQIVDDDSDDEHSSQSDTEIVGSPAHCMAEKCRYSVGNTQGDENLQQETGTEAFPA